ncbi:MAG: SoxR reducing system RseC family protein [Candidatus Thioglobus sp.]|nr:MAG: SoxR reducing system RseC family protein [Candidatus Thioglobus sp.]
MKEQFEIIQIEKQTQTMRLKASNSAGCHSCSAAGGCGTGILAKYFAHYSSFEKPLQNGVVVGDFVILEILASELFYRAFQLYILPLLALFSGAIFADRLYPQQEIVQIAFAFVAFFAALLLTKYFVK